MASEDEFEAAVARIKSQAGVGQGEQLALYALYKQATAGDVAGARPGLLDVRGRAKYDAWAGKKGLSAADARAAYVALVAKLVG
ncbi:MAG TPA: acyl-CoA-binding protein [Kofleriaceae bacterium]|nr:acyl-CoA-binding protein [Kofleriaceae bacterium]